MKLDGAEARARDREPLVPSSLTVEDAGTPYMYFRTFPMPPSCAINTTAVAGEVAT